MNQGPASGILASDPRNGIEMATTFSIVAMNWVDPENDIPLQYAFGYFINGISQNLNSKNLTSVLYTSFPYSREQIMVYVDVFDAVSTYTRATCNITVEMQANLDISQSVTNIQSVLDSPTFNPSSAPLLISQIASIALNRNIDDSNTVTEVTEVMQNAYDLSMNAINSFVTTMNAFDQDSITSIMSMLTSVTLNPSLNTPENIQKVSDVIDNMISSINGTSTLKDDQVQTFMGICDNNFQVDSSKVENSTNLISVIENNIQKINSNLLSGMIEGEIKTFTQGKVAIGIASEGISNLANYNMSVENAGMQLSNDILSALSGLSNVGISLTSYSPIPNDVNASFSLVSFNLIDLNNQNSLVVTNLTTYNRIVIPAINIDSDTSINCTYTETGYSNISTDGCILESFNDTHVICLCNHLSIFSALTSSALDTLVTSNIGDTINVDAFNNLDLDSNAIGLYFCFGIILCYIIFSMISFKLDKRDQEKLKAALSAISTLNITSRTEDSVVITEDPSFVEESPRLQPANVDVDQIEAAMHQKPQDKKPKGIVKYILYNHDIISMFTHSYEYSRFCRTTQFITMVLGNMFFIGLFYQNENTDGISSNLSDIFSGYTLRDFWVMVYSSLLMLGIGLILKYLAKKSLISITATHAQVRYINRKNKAKIISFYIFCWLMMGWFCWSIILFSIQFELNLAYMWVFNTIVSYGSDFFVISFLKLALRGLMF